MRERFTKLRQCLVGLTGRVLAVGVLASVVINGLVPVSALPQEVVNNPTRIRVMTFNILQGGGEAANVGFPNAEFGGSRIDEIVAAIKAAEADVVGVQEDCSSERLLEALGDGWFRGGSVYSRFPLGEVKSAPYLTRAEIVLAANRKLTIVNCHWFPPAGGYGPDVIQAELRKGTGLDAGELAKLAVERCYQPAGPRGYEATVELLRAPLESNRNTILLGDFNEPSHLDWTERYATEGADRWVANPSGTPLRLAVPWPGSRRLEELGLQDSYRAVYPDEVAKPGHTWTPAYADETPGRRPFGEQCLDRIDRIYHFGPGLSPRQAAVVGESEPNAQIVSPVRWPSDHRAVVVEFEIR